MRVRKATVDWIGGCCIVSGGERAFAGLGKERRGQEEEGMRMV